MVGGQEEYTEESKGGGEDVLPNSDPVQLRPHIRGRPEEAGRPKKKVFWKRKKKGNG